MLKKKRITHQVIKQMGKHQETQLNEIRLTRQGEPKLNTTRMRRGTIK